MRAEDPGRLCTQGKGNEAKDYTGKGEREPPMQFDKFGVVPDLSGLLLQNSIL